MGHLSGHHRAYQDLQRSLDRMPPSFPETPEAMAILELLFTPEEAALVARLPFRPSSARTIGAKLGLPEAEAQTKLERLADRGLVLDLYSEERGRSYYCIAPPVVGFFEFSLMRRRQDIDQPALAAAYENYFEADGNFGPTLFGGQTTIGRTLVHEEALAPDDAAELLTYERASDVVGEASARAVSLCYCRHKAEHLGHPCRQAPLENCLSLNNGAAFVIRHGWGRPLERGEGLEILARSREQGLVYIADNVQQRVTYVCQCCPCCCGQLLAINRYGLAEAVKTSPALAQIDPAKCTGCGRCSRRCPVQAISLHPRPQHVRARDEQADKKPMYATVDEELCLGCGVCQPECRKQALTLALRGARVLTPESTLERILVMALERDRLQHLIFDEREGVPMMLLNRLAGAVLRLPPLKRALLGEKLRSRFLRFLASQPAAKAMPKGLAL